MMPLLNHPFDPQTILRKKRSIRRELLQRVPVLEKRIAILGGSTTSEIKEILELFLLNEGIRPVFYESEYARYEEDILYPNPALEAFAPEIIYICTTSRNIRASASFVDSKAAVEEKIDQEFARFQALWDTIQAKYSCVVIQNNFELPSHRILGNLDFYDARGKVWLVNQLNQRLSLHAQDAPNLYVNDINYLSACFGLERWHDKQFWYSYKYAMCYEAIPSLAHSVASIIRAIYGRAKKCLVLDLDNTLWGGVIGDEGMKGIKIGKETPEAEAYSDFQGYIRLLKERGAILAVCSKNDEENAREGFSHPDSVLKCSDFSAFKANWEPKYLNVRDIAASLNIGMDSLVFVDDNPVERDAVRSQEPEVAVPEIGGKIENYLDILDKAGYFETVSLSDDDLKRASFYSDNAGREQLQSKFDSYEDFIRSLDMQAEILPFNEIYLDRITQLTNKTNQFNLTTKRYSYAEIEALLNSPGHIALYGRLQDKFGDNGLVSVVIGSIEGTTLHVELWLMSCRVLKRGMEQAMFDQLVARALELGLTRIVGYYYPTPKNAMVEGLYRDFGFLPGQSQNGGDSIWHYDIPERYVQQNTIIEVNANV